MTGGNFEWHDIRDPNDPELDRLAERYHIHPLHVEDCRHRDQSAKLDESEGYIFTVLKPARIQSDGCLNIADLDVILGRDFLITVEEHDCPEIQRMIDQIRSAAGGLRPDQAYYRVVDGLVDSYLPILDGFSDALDALEDQVLDRPTPDAAAHIFGVKRDLILLRRALVNTRDVAGHLLRSESQLIQRDMWPYLRDIYDHVARNLDTVEMLRDLLSGTLDVYLSSVANRTNQVMKVLTVMGTVALPALLISSIYGMNIKGLLWLESPHAAFYVAGTMVLLTAILLAILRWFRWL